jgi:hypothetical protein
MSSTAGDLSLNAAAGNAGLPLGHVVAYKPDHDLALLFIDALRAATADGDWVPMREL